MRTLNIEEAIDFVSANSLATLDAALGTGAVTFDSESVTKEVVELIHDYIDMYDDTLMLDESPYLDTFIADYVLARPLGINADYCAEMLLAAVDVGAVADEVREAFNAVER